MKKKMREQIMTVAYLIPVSICISLQQKPKPIRLWHYDKGLDQVGLAMRWWDAATEIARKLLWPFCRSGTYLCCLLIQHSAKEKYIQNLTSSQKPTFQLIKNRIFSNFIFFTFLGFHNHTPISNYIHYFCQYS